MKIRTDCAKSKERGGGLVGGRVGAGFLKGVLHVLDNLDIVVVRLAVRVAERDDLHCSLISSCSSLQKIEPNAPFRLRPDGPASLDASSLFVRPAASIRSRKELTFFLSGELSFLIAFQSTRPPVVR